MIPIEDHPPEQARALAVRAREALPLALRPTGVEAAVGLLAQAIERLTDDIPHFALNSDEYGPGQLEALRGPISGRKEDRKYFVISFADVVLGEEDIWPNEAAVPENPTPEDVIRVMKENGCDPMSIAAEWLLVESLFVSTVGDDDMVEWDGT